MYLIMNPSLQEFAKLVQSSFLIFLKACLSLKGKTFTISHLATLEKNLKVSTLIKLKYFPHYEKYF